MRGGIVVIASLEKEEQGERKDANISNGTGRWASRRERRYSDCYADRDFPSLDKGASYDGSFLVLKGQTFQVLQTRDPVGVVVVVVVECPSDTWDSRTHHGADFNRLARNSCVFIDVLNNYFLLLPLLL